MKKFLAIAALSLTLGVMAKPAEAGVAYTPGMPIGAKIAVIAVGAMVFSVMTQAIIVNNLQKRPLTVAEGQYAALLPFLWVFRPLPVEVLAKKRR